MSSASSSRSTPQRAPLKSVVGKALSGSSSATSTPGAAVYDASQSFLTPGRVLVTPARPHQAGPASASSPGPCRAVNPLRGLSGGMPMLWHTLEFIPEGIKRDLTAAQREVLGDIEAFEIPQGVSIGPLSGCTGEERLLAAYYNGRLTLKRGESRPPLRCSCCLGGHFPFECPQKV